MFKRIKTAWKLSKYPNAIYIPTEALTSKDPRVFIEDIVQANPSLIEGDGNAAFFGDPTEQEQLDHQRELDGTLPWYKRLKNL